jgi:hypothetical protein
MRDLLQLQYKIGLPLCEPLIHHLREGVTNPTPKAEDLERMGCKRNRTKGGWRTTRIPFRL